MKKHYFLGCALAALAFAACSDNDNPPAPSDPTVISFEQDEALIDRLGEPVVPGRIEVEGWTSFASDGVYWPKALANRIGERDEKGQICLIGAYFYTADRLAGFGVNYNDGTSWDEAGEKVTDTWGGLVLSRNSTRQREAAAITQQFTAWGAGGANGTETFAVGFDSNRAGEGFTPPQEYNAPQVDFVRPCVPVHIFLANSAYTFNYFTEDYFTGDRAATTYAVKITGSLGGKTTGEAVCTLIGADARVAEWVKVDLSGLGTVDCLLFEAVTEDGMAPMFFCMDELALLPAAE